MEGSMLAGGRVRAIRTRSTGALRKLMVVRP
jgi:hypothetical protein